MGTIMPTHLLQSTSSSISLHEQEDATSRTNDLATSSMNETSVIASSSTIRFDLDNITVHTVKRIDDISQAEGER
jgi:hypothetical protein